MNPVYFDLESGPLPLEELQSIMPVFEAASNLKDPEKIAASIEAKRQAWIADAALSPLTGQVLVIGLLSNDETTFVSGTERGIIESFLTKADETLSTGNQLIGFNILSFDLPFILKKAHKHSVRVPRIIGGWTGRYWNWSDQIIDIRLLWQMGDRKAHGSLDSISQFLGLGRKNGNGAQFAKLYETDRESALNYLRNDLALTEKIYLRMNGK